MIAVRSYLLAFSHLTGETSLTYIKRGQSGAACGLALTGRMRCQSCSQKSFICRWKNHGAMSLISPPTPKTCRTGPPV
ncbi:hypothetical protein EXN24_04940 [Rhizobium rhizogenes]|uniref:Uncharacterized protein n=1 Tax=Rhizobium rhizogenes TaxID=359 RepID=A0AA94VF76_RHIRH|nr:hypothetical protein EXN24_04940 [Rhizobium rhizogenes]